MHTAVRSLGVYLLVRLCSSQSQIFFLSLFSVELVSRVQSHNPKSSGSIAVGLASPSVCLSVCPCVCRGRPDLNEQQLHTYGQNLVRYYSQCKDGQIHLYCLRSRRNDCVHLYCDLGGFITNPTEDFLF